MNSLEIRADPRGLFLLQLMEGAMDDRISRRVRKRKRKERLKHIRYKRKLQKLEESKKKKEQQSSLVWVWEFSKKVVYICVLFWMGVYVYAGVAMWKFFDFTYLGTMIEQVSMILSSCVFGYFIKSGAENVFKIALSKIEFKNTKEVADETINTMQTALTAPDGEE